MIMRRVTRPLSGTFLPLRPGQARHAEAMRLEECAVFTVKYGLTIKTAAAYWVISSKPIARQADQACGRLE
jgi:hypothetical protein